MNNLKEIRWKQRFENFEKSYNSLLKFVYKPITSELERAGIIQLFEIAFELAWKLMKDYLEAQHITTKSPRETIKQAYQIEIIEDGHVWIDALSDRNRTVHTYDEKLAIRMVEDIQNLYFPQLEKLYKELSKEK